MVRLSTLLVLLLVALVPARAQGNAKKLTSAADYFFAGEEAHEKGNEQEAIQYYTDCLRLRASYKEAYRSRAVAEEALENLGAALRDYTLYLELETDDPSEVLFSRAVLNFRLAHYQQAKEDFTALLSYPAGTTNAIFFRVDTFTEGADKMFTTQGSYTSVLYDYLGQTETKLKNYPDAITYFDKAVKLNSQDTNLWLHRGVAKEKAGNVEGAALDYQTALHIDPYLSLAQYNLAQLKGKKGENDQAKEFIDKAIENNRALPYPYAQRAQFKTNRGDLKGARSDYDSAIRSNPTDPNYWLNRGLVKEKLKDLSGAANDFSQAIELKEDFDKAWFARANLCVKQNKLSAAIDDFTITIFHNAVHSGAYYNRGLAYQRVNKLKEACEDFTIAESLGMTIDAALKVNCK
jgi:tetratricopeptide (TPR) repeat protein